MEDWPTIIRSYTPVVWETVYRLLGNQADAADAYQESFIAALAISRREQVNNWEATLRHLATARAIDVMRRRLRERGRLEEPAAWEEMAGPVPEPSERAEERELIGHLRLLVAELPADQAEVYCLRFIHEWTYQQIANELRITPNAVGVQLNRIRARLAAALAAKGMSVEVKYGK
jgi:RNA polymerase sigma factor (sigma-70 family)